MYEETTDVAIVGMAIRFPGAKTVEEHWRNVRERVECVSFFGDEELEGSNVSEELLKNPSVVKAGGILEDVDRFDARFFGFSDREAEITDPQQRLLMECCWEAMERSGHASTKYEGLVGVFAGIGMGTYLFENVYPNREIRRSVGRFRLMMGNHSNFLSSWIAYKLDLRGPAVSVQTACSTSLVAVHLAWQSLLNGECDMALAGGSSISLPQKACYVYREGGIQSPDGRCRAFDARANGTVGGNGVGVVMLKRLADALADEDRIHAVIKGSAINNDGSLKVGYTAPSVEGQAAAVAEALEISGCSPETVRFLQAHGTGTSLGDPIEIAALTRAYRNWSERRGFCAVSSVKPNVGHLDTAAGVAGLVTAVAALDNREIPPTLHFEEPNPQCNFEESPFYVSDRVEEWERGETPRRAGVSSLGIGGTNAHVVLEEAPEREPSEPGRPDRLLALSARTEAALGEARRRLAEHLRQHPETDPADAAFTLHLGRRDFEHRAVVVGRRATELAEILEGGGGRLRTSVEETRNRPVVFLFPGQGAQKVGMGRDLYETERVFREELDRAAEILTPDLGLDLRGVLYPESADDDAAARLDRTELAQPALFAVEHALARLWMAWGVRPEAMLGHSLGEYTAACLAGVLSLEHALALVAERGRLMQCLDGGAMLAVSASAEELAKEIEEPLVIAAVNAPQRVVVSGPEGAVSRLQSELEGGKVACRRLATYHAFHSPAVDPILEAFERRLEAVELRPPELPIVSSVTGTWAGPGELTNAAYWRDQIRRPVSFSDAVRTLLAEPDRVLLEVGPGEELCQLVGLHRDARQGQPTIPSLGRPRRGASEGHRLLAALGSLWLTGIAPDWKALYSEERRHRLDLPTCPFERRSYWLEAPARPSHGNEAGSPREDRPARRAPAEAPENGDRRSRIVRRLGEIVQQLTGTPAEALETEATFFELGVDSLLLIQASQRIERAFGHAVPFRALFEDLSTLDAVADYLDAELPEDALAPEEPAARPAPVADLGGDLGGPEGLLPGPGEAGLDAGTLERIVSRQLETMRQFMERQLEVLAQRPGATAPDAGTGSGTPARPEARRPEPPVAESYEDVVAPVVDAQVDGPDGLSPRQLRHLEELVEAYTTRTRESKRRTARYRQVLADNRNSVGFRRIWKEITYPILADRSLGSRIWDVDGNEYVDLAMGFGVNLLGHKPPFVEEALRRQLERGIHVGPQSDLAGEVAERLCRLTGNERAIFANSGTEAVMTALRLARAVTGRSRIALFRGSYHGFYDGTVARRLGLGAGAQVIPAAPGIPDGAVQDLLLLDYGSEESLKILEAEAKGLAGVLVEPVQSRRPSLQPREFLHALRKLTERAGIPLIFDEMITGFRCHPGGAQAWFDVRADLATYGKAVGGGMPLGVIAGRGEYMNAIDGGPWRFGDESLPSARQTLFAGTFCKHPLAMSAAQAVLEHLEEEGPELQERLNAQTGRMIASLNDWLEREGMPLRAESFASLFRLRPTRRWRHGELLRYHLALRGVYVWEGDTRFLSTAHSDGEVEFVLGGVREALLAIRRAGFLPEDGRPEEEPSSARTLPLTVTQRQVWALTRMGDDTSRAYNEPITLNLRGSLEPGAAARALRRIVARHEALRTTFDLDEPVQRVRPSGTVDLPAVDLSRLAATPGEEAARRATRQVMELPFALDRDVLLRCLLVRLADRHHRLLLVSHHVVVDGRSFGTLLLDFSRLYRVELQGDPVAVPPAAGFRSYLANRVPPTESQLREAEQYWLSQFADPVPDLELPVDGELRAHRSHAVGQAKAVFGPGLREDLGRLTGEQGTTLFVTLLAALNLLLRQLSGQKDVVVGFNASEPGSRDQGALIGSQIHPLAIRLRAPDDVTFADFLGRAREAVLEGYRHQVYPMSRLLEKLDLRREPGWPPLASVVLNLGGQSAPLELPGLEVEVVPEAAGAKVDLYFEVDEVPEGLRALCNFSRDLFRTERVASWLAHFERLLRTVAESPHLPLGEFPAPPTPATGTAAERELDALYDRSNLGRFQLTQWMGQKLQPDLPIYLSAGSFRIPRAVDPERFRRALGYLIERSSALRTVLEEVEGVPRRRVLDSLPVAMSHIDLRGLPDAEAELARSTRRFLGRPFELGRRLFHTFLASLGEEDSCWVLIQHHSMADAVTNALTWRYVVEVYEALGEGREPELEVPDYQDFVDWEREYLASPEGREARRHWQCKLASPAEPLHLYGRRNADPGDTATEREELVLDATIVASLERFCDRKDVSSKAPTRSLLYLIVMTAVEAYLLARLGGVEEVSLGVPFANRPNRRLGEALGLFVNYVPIRVRVDPSESFLCLIDRVAAEVREAWPHRHFPLGNALAHRAYEVELNFLSTELRPFDGVEVGLEHLHTGHANELVVTELVRSEATGEIRGFFDFRRAAAEPHERRWATRSFATLLETFLETPEEPMEAVEAFPPEARHALWVEGNDTALELPLNRTAWELFQARARETPDRVAADTGGAALTYGALERRAVQAACGLDAAGVAPGDVVALYLERGLEVLTAVLAAFRLGVAYLPLDPADPVPRQAEILGGGKPRLVVTTADLASRLAGLGEGQAGAQEGESKTFESLLAAGGGKGAGAPAPNGHPESLAYVLYTSGSTGAPKGVMVEQRGMVNHLLSKVRDLGLSADDRVLQNASQGFDISVWQFLAALLVGGRVDVAEDALARDPVRLFERLEERRITVVETVPSLLEAIVDAIGLSGRPAPELRSLRWMMATGEALPPELCRQWLALYPRVPVLNAYGPTECSDDVTHALVDEPPASGVARMPIGRPLPNLRIFVLDNRLRPVPPGVPGELCVAGVGVGRGYLGRPAQTAGVFVPDPASPEPGGRLYRTGDIGRALAGGELDFLGRFDYQVKVRGFRVEPGEVEAVLLTHAGVRSAVVVTRDDGRSGKHLVAYVVPTEGGRAEAEDLGRHAASRLPDPMVPAIFVHLPKLPLTPDGKVDRSALPEPRRDSRRSGGHTAPRGAVEETLAAIWAEVLGVERVGVEDDFFALGGDSLLAIQISSRARRVGLDIAPMTFFRQRTVAELAAVAGGGRREATAEQGPVSGDVPLIPIEHWFLDHQPANPHHWNQSLLLEVHERLEAAVLDRAVSLLVAHHDALRLRLIRVGALARQHNAEVETARCFVTVDLSGLGAADARRAAIEAGAARLQGSLHLERGPLVRVALFRTGSEHPDRLFVVAHHIAVDVVSWRILLEDLLHCVRALRREEEPALPPKTTSFRSWVQRLEAWARSPELQREEDLWRSVAEAPSAVPRDREAQAGEPPRTASHTVSLEAETTSALLTTVAGTFDSEIHHALLAALGTALFRWCGEPRLSVALESHGREEIFEGVDLNRTVGWFTSLFPVVLEHRDDPRDSLAGVRRELRRAPHRGIGYGVLRYLARSEPLGAAGSEPEVRFNYLGHADRALPSRGPLRLARERTGRSVAPGGEPPFLLDVNAWVHDDHLRVSWSFDERVHDPATVREVAETYLDALRALVEAARKPGAGPEIAGEEYGWSDEEVEEIRGVLEGEE